MSYENVRLWFARDENGEIVTIDEVKEIHNTYNCPVCGSSLLPKATESKKVTPHFAHIDASKCNSEHFIHWWYKNKLIQPGDEFKIVTDKEIKYICKEILVEQSYPTSFGEYRPDVTVITDTGETIYFEMAFSNKKKIKDYLDIWLEVNHIVVEVNIKDLIGMTALPTFKSLFHKGKCFNLKQNDHYYNYIGKYKERICEEGISEDTKERLRNLNWFWIEVFNYRKGTRDIDYMTNLIDSVSNKDIEIVEEVLNKKMCITLYRNYLEHKNEKLWTNIKHEVLTHYGEEYLSYIKEPYVQHERYFGTNSYLEVYHEDERCYYVSNLKYKKVDEVCQSVLQTLKRNCDYKIIHRKLEIYDDKLNVIDKQIAQIINDEEIFMNLKEHYSVEYYMANRYISPSRILDYDLDVLKAEFKLIYNNYETAACKTIAIHDNANIYKLVLDVKNVFMEFINNINSLDNIEELSILTDYIQQQFKHYKIKTTGKLILEDEYAIYIDYDSGDFPSHYFSNYYIKSTGLYTGYERILLSQDRTEYKSVIFQNITNELIKSFEGECNECEERFNLTMGEALFYRKKSFKFPKRCKSCRKNRTR